MSFRPKTQQRIYVVVAFLLATFALFFFIGQNRVHVVGVRAYYQEEQRLVDVTVHNPTDAAISATVVVSFDSLSDEVPSQSRRFLGNVELQPQSRRTVTVAVEQVSGIFDLEVLRQPHARVSRIEPLSQPAK